MHEHSFIQSIISEVENQDKVRAVVIEVGELAGIEADHLKEHLESHTGWRVTSNSKEATVKCGCGFIGAPKVRERLHDMVIFECPMCGNIPSVLEGDKIKILSIEYCD